MERLRPADAPEEVEHDEVADAIDVLADMNNEADAMAMPEAQEELQDVTVADIGEDWDEKRIYAFVIAEADRFRKHYDRVFPAYLQEEEDADEEELPKDLLQEPQDLEDDPALSSWKPTRLPPGPPPSGTVLLRAGRDAMAIRRVLVGGLQALFGTLKMRPWTWQDHETHKGELRHYLEAGISVTDLRAAGVLRTYSDLCTRFNFTPADLAVNRMIFSASQLANLFHVTWEKLLLDFAVSPFIYMQVLKLPLEDMASIGLTKHDLLKWDARSVFRQNKRPVPGENDSYSDPHIANLQQRLDRDMFIACPHYQPSDWTMYMGLTVEDLETLGVRGEDLWELWHDSFASVGDILREFGWQPDTAAEKVPRAFRFSKMASVHSTPSLPELSDTLYAPMPGSLRQLKSQQRVGDAVEGAMWEPEEHLLYDDQSSDDDDSSSSEKEEQRQRRAPSSSGHRESNHERHRRKKREHNARKSRHRREHREEEEDSGFGDLIPAISSLLIGPPKNADDQKRSKSRRRKRDHDTREKRHPMH